MSDDFKLEASEPESQPEPVAVTPGTLDIRLCDCMDLMREFPDGYFDLAIVDPPYGLGNKLVAGGTWSVKYQAKGAEWDIAPGEQYFREMMRVAKNWIVWGGNYFTQFLPPSRHFIPWHKPNMAGMHTMSDVELALTSFDRNSRVLPLTSQTESGTSRFHVCQKPTELYRRLLANYAKPGMKILDTHLGSGSHAIACHYAGMHLTACEIDPDYYHAAMERIERETAQTTLL